MDWPVPSVVLFDVDHTIEISSGPVTLQQIVEVWKAGHIVGLCGNFALFVQLVPDWHHVISILGSGGMTKVDFMVMIRSYVPAKRYIMVGNDEPGKSEDGAAARQAGWQFIKEDAFADHVPIPGTNSVSVR